MENQEYQPNEDLEIEYSAELIDNHSENPMFMKYMQILPIIINIFIAISLAIIPIGFKEYVGIIELIAQTFFRAGSYSLLLLTVICGIIGFYNLFYFILVHKKPLHSHQSILSRIPMLCALFFEILFLFLFSKIDFITIYEIYNIMGDIAGSIVYFINLTSIILVSLFLFSWITVFWKKTKKEQGYRLILINTIIWYCIYIPFFFILVIQHPRLIFWEYNILGFNWRDIWVYIHAISFLVSIIFSGYLWKKQKNISSRKNIFKIVIICIILQIFSIISLVIKYQNWNTVYNPLFFLTLGLINTLITLYFKNKKRKLFKSNIKSNEKFLNQPARKKSAVGMILIIIMPIVWIVFYQPIFILMPRNISLVDDVAEYPIIQNSYEHLTPTQKLLFDEALDVEFPYGSNFTIFEDGNRDTRTAIRIASGLLYRNWPGDIENASKIIEIVLDQQYLDKSEDIYGSWRTDINEDTRDYNWREFIGCELILILERHSEKLSTALISKIKTSLVVASDGAQKRDITPTYSNIALMSSFLMEYTGEKMNRNDFKETGLEKAWQCYILFNRDEAFSEFNSPTYDGVSMMALAFWRTLSPNEEMRIMGRNLEIQFWKNIVKFYHPGLKNMVGPFFRAYGMDMNKYNAIIGMWITLVIDDLADGPYPRFSGSKSGECNNIIPAVQLGHITNEDIKNKLLEIPTSRYIVKNVPISLDFLSINMKVTVSITEKWMMGGVEGILRVDRTTEQIKVGTIYWKSTIDNSIQWLMVPSYQSQDVFVTEECMRIRRNDASNELIFFIQMDSVDLSLFESKYWSLSGLKITSSLLPSVLSTEIIDSDQFRDDFSISEDVETIIQITADVNEIELDLSNN